MTYTDYGEEYRQEPEGRDVVCVDLCLSIKNAINYLNAHYTQQISLEEICKVAMMSQSAFIKAFKRIVGKTLIEYIHLQRVDLAKELLQKTKLNITTVGEECGFGDSSYFGKVFKKYTGMTPKQYKTSKRNDFTKCV